MSAAVPVPGRRRIVIVGGGMAAGRLIGRLLARGCGDAITLISAETLVAYDRVRLPDLLAGRCGVDALDLRGGWDGAQRVRVIAGDAAVSLDLDARQLITASGRIVPFDELVLATGSSVPVPAVPGVDLPGVGVFRSRDDALRLRGSARDGAVVTIVGGGLLGLETAESFLDAGARVRVLHRRDRLMNRQLDAEGAGILARFLTERGVECVLGADVAELVGDGRVRAVRLTDGRELATTEVVFATGSVPNDALAAQAGLACDRGILVDARLRTAVRGIHALGECARVDGRHYALVAPVHRQADVLAAQLLRDNGAGDPVFDPPAVATRLKVSGIEVFSAGDPGAAVDRPDIRIADPARGVHRRLWFDEGRLSAAVLVGDATGSRHIEESIGRVPPSRAHRNALAFGLDVGMGAAA